MLSIFYLKLQEGGIKKKMRRLWRSRKALSPVVAAIILIAVTVAVSIAVAAWMGALTFTFMGYEKLEITTIKWSPNTSFNITIKNTGTKDLTISHIEVNHVGLSNTLVSPQPPMPFKTTDSAKTLIITYTYVNGTAYDVSVVTSGGYKFTDNFIGGQDTPS